jgi:hypothetical protein
LRVQESAAPEQELVQLPVLKALPVQVPRVRAPRVLPLLLSGLQAQVPPVPLLRRHKPPVPWPLLRPVPEAKRLYFSSVSSQMICLRLSPPNFALASEDLPTR